MKNRIIIVLALILLLSTVGSVVVFSTDIDTSVDKSGVAEASNKIVPTPSDSHKVTKTNDGKIIFKNYDNETVELKYSSATTTVAGEARKIYADSKNRQYWVNDDNEVVGIDSTNSTDRRNVIDIPADELIDEKEASKIANLEAKRFYGAKFSDFELASVEVTDRHYWFEYQRNFGVDDCISGGECGVILQPDGNLISLGITNYEATKDLDPALLADFTKDKLLDIAEANVRAVYMDKLTSWNLKKTQVVNTDNGYALMFLVTAEFINEDGIALSSTDRYYYVVS